MHNATDDLMGATVSGPDLGIKLYRIEMRGDSGWVPLGGIYDEPTASERISQFSDAFMVAPGGPGSGRTCKRDFRTCQVSRFGHPI